MSLTRRYIFRKPLFLSLLVMLFCMGALVACTQDPYKEAEEHFRKANELQRLKGDLFSNSDIQVSIGGEDKYVIFTDIEEEKHIPLQVALAGVLSDMPFEVVIDNNQSKAIFFEKLSFEGDHFVLKLKPSVFDLDVDAHMRSSQFSFSVLVPEAGVKLDYKVPVIALRFSGGRRSGDAYQISYEQLNDISGERVCFTFENLLESEKRMLRSRGNGIDVAYFYPSGQAPQGLRAGLVFANAKLTFYRWGEQPDQFKPCIYMKDPKYVNFLYKGEYEVGFVFFDNGRGCFKTCCCEGEFGFQA